MRTTHATTLRRFAAAVLALGTLALAAPAVASAAPPIPGDKVGIPVDPCDDLLLPCPGGGEDPDPDPDPDPQDPCEVAPEQYPERCDVPDEEREPEDEPRNPDVVVADPTFTG